MVPESFGKYRIDTVVGSGAFGTVYRAVDSTLDRVVALKVLDPVLVRDERWVVRFQREAKAMARLEHPNIVSIYEIGEHDSRLFIAMQYVDGPNLREHLNSSGALSWEASLGLVNNIAAALDHAHAAGVLHRDLKPENVMVGPAGALLTDFGLAALVAQSRISTSLSGGIVGSPPYIPPEIWNGEEPTAATDVYALGCILYELLTNVILFEDSQTPAIMRAHFEPVKLPERWPPGTPPEINEVLAVALAKEPAKRFQTAGAFFNALKHAKSVPARAVRTSVIPAAAIASTSRATIPPQATVVGVAPSEQSGQAASDQKPTPQRKSSFRRFVRISAILIFLLLLTLICGSALTLIALNDGVPSVETIISMFFSQDTETPASATVTATSQVAEETIDPDNPSPSATESPPTIATDMPETVNDPTVEITKEPTATPGPTNTREPTSTPRPTSTPTATATPVPTVVLPFFDSFDTGLGPGWRLIRGSPLVTQGHLTTASDEMLFELVHHLPEDFTISFDRLGGCATELTFNERLLMQIRRWDVYWYSFEGNQWIELANADGLSGADGLIAFRASGNNYQFFFNNTLLYELVYGEPQRGVLSLKLEDCSEIDNFQVTSP